MSPERQTEVKQVIPEERILPLEGLYLLQELKKVAEKLGRPIVTTGYVSDRNDVIAVPSPDGEFQVPGELKNPSDWRLFQELIAQADVILTGAGYLNRFAKMGEAAQNILTQFEEGGKFQDLGNWRVENGYKTKNPDIAVISRSLDFEIPPVLLKMDRGVLVFTTYEGAKSKKAKELAKSGAEVVGAGEDGVDGKILVDSLSQRGYLVIKNTTGPRVLKILLDAQVLDRLYVTQVQKEIGAGKSVQTILIDGGSVGKLPGFALTAKYIQESAVSEGVTKVPQHFLIYDSEKFLSDIESST